MVVGNMVGHCVARIGPRPARVERGTCSMSVADVDDREMRDELLRPVIDDRAGRFIARVDVVAGDRRRVAGSTAA